MRFQCSSSKGITPYLQPWFLGSVKLGKGGPGGGNFCIHKYFYSQSAFWKSVRSEEHVDEDEDGQQGDRFSEHEAPTDLRAKLQFDPIDSRHLASTELIKSRVVKLLKNSENGLHLYHNLIVTIVISACSTSKNNITEVVVRGFSNLLSRTGDFSIFESEN